MLRPPSLLLSLAFLLSCRRDKDSDPPAGDDTASETWTPDVWCPGDPGGGCADSSGTFRAGAAAVTVTPTCFESWGDTDADGEFDDEEVYYDCGCDRLCPGDDGYTAPDEGEADGKFQAVWLAGFHNNRPAIEVHDDLWARAIIFEQGQTRVGLVVLDLVGWFNGEVVTTRDLAAEAGLELDLLFISSTHNHEAPDTMGLWGRTESSGGYDPEYAAYIHQRTVEALQRAASDLRDVGRFVVGAGDVTAYSARGTGPLVRDTRDPKVIDALLRVALIEDTQGETIATLTHFGNHPEAMADENVQITSDFPGPLRTNLEAGFAYESGYARAGYGGTAIFINGPVGGLMTPLGTTVVDADGAEYRDYTFEKLDATGKVMADIAMDAIEGGEDITSSLSLAAATTRFRMPIENYGFQALFLAGIFPREVYDWDPSRPIDDTNLPYIETELSWLRVGELELLTMPGELFPELAIGGYDGSHVGNPEDSVVDADNPAPPDLSAAPTGPYLLDRLSGSARWIVGLGNDQLGYIVPAYDFVLDEANPWFDEAEGDHYEETNSLGPQTAPLLEDRAATLLGWVDANLR